MTLAELVSSCCERDPLQRRISGGRMSEHGSLFSTRKLHQLSCQSPLPLGAGLG
jgi:hypothetical protein